MRILHVIANLAPRHGGPVKACVEMARSLVDMGHEVDIFTTDQDGPNRLNVATDAPHRKDGVNTHFFRAQTLRGWPCVSFSLWRALRAKVHEYDVVHVHSLYLFHGMVASYYCGKCDVPYLIRPCGALDPYLYKRHRLRKSICEMLFENRNIKNAAAIHFTTEEEKQLAQPFTHGTLGVVAPLGLHLSEYENLPNPGTFRSAYPAIGGKKIILFFGRINFKKGLDILIDAFARVAQVRNDVHLVLAGPDNERYGVKVKTWAREKGIERQTTFTGMLQGNMKLAVLKDSTIFVLPSYTENFGLSVIEAMACGLPVVISNKVNIWREVQSAGAGVVAPCDARRFSAMISALLDDPGRATVMGKRGMALVQSSFSWSNVALKLERIYNLVLEDSELPKHQQTQFVEQ